MASFDSLKAQVEGLSFQARMARVLTERFPSEKFQSHQNRMISEALGVSRSVVYQKFSGSTPFNVIDAWVLSKNFNFSMDYLLFGTGEPIRVTEIRQKEITEEEKSAEELIEEFKDKCRKQGFAVAGAWLQHKTDA